MVVFHGLAVHGSWYAYTIRPRYTIHHKYTKHHRLIRFYNKLLVKKVKALGPSMAGDTWRVPYCWPVAYVPMPSQVLPNLQTIERVIMVERNRKLPPRPRSCFSLVRKPSGSYFLTFVINLNCSPHDNFMTELL